MCFPKPPKPTPVIYDSQSREVQNAADAVAYQRRSAQGYQFSVGGGGGGAPTLGQQVLLGSGP